MKKAFTLVELLVVIGIIGILSGVLIASFSGSSESARAAKCLTNLKNLASASQLYSSATTWMPQSSSGSYLSEDGERYYETPGWVSWYSVEQFPKVDDNNGRRYSYSDTRGEDLSTYIVDKVKRIYSLTNGVLWKYLSGTSSAYVCPEHVEAVAPKFRPLWSYVMSPSVSGWKYKSVTRADRRLLFAEMPFDGTDNGNYAPSTSLSKYNDSALQYWEGDVIGFNHKAGKGEKCAHVVFVDGHVEKLRQPKGGLSDSQLKDLTTWLCEGKDISFDGEKYEKLTD